MRALNPRLRSSQPTQMLPQELSWAKHNCLEAQRQCTGLRAATEDAKQQLASALDESQRFKERTSRRESHLLAASKASKAKAKGLEQQLADVTEDLQRSQVEAQQLRQFAQAAGSQSLAHWTEANAWRSRAEELQRQLALSQQQAAAAQKEESFTLRDVKDGILQDLRSATDAKDRERRVRALLLAWHPDKHPFQQRIANRVTQTINEVRLWF